MTQEEKDILLADLTARLPYSNTICQYYDIDTNDYKTGYIEGFEKNDTFIINELGIPVEDIKPYLFPLSNSIMTDKQKDELNEEKMKDVKIMANLLKINNPDKRGTGILYYAQDWCNKNNFDYRGLIPLGLANDATGLNIY